MALTSTCQGLLRGTSPEEGPKDWESQGVGVPGDLGGPHHTPHKAHQSTSPVPAELKLPPVLEPPSPLPGKPRVQSGGEAFARKGTGDGGTEEAEARETEMMQETRRTSREAVIDTLGENRQSIKQRKNETL